MRTIKELIKIRGYGLKGLAVTAAAVLLVAAPYGCSKEESPKPKAATETQAEAPADSAQEQFNIGVQASLKGDYDTAIKAYEKAIELDPKSAEAYNNMGFAYYDSGDIDKAIELQRKAMEINPYLPNVYYGLALALEKKGDDKGAVENWKSFIKFAEPHSKWWIKAQERIVAIDNGTEDGK